MKKNVLILGVASVQMDAILTLQEMGYTVFACAMAKDGPGADVADAFYEINILDEDQLIALIREHEIMAVYSTGSDLAMPVACRISEQLHLPHFVSADAAYRCNHKNAMRQTLTADCEGNVPYAVLTDATQAETLDSVLFPAIMKPSDSQGQRGIFLVESPEDVRLHFAEACGFSREKKVIVERYIAGTEISVNAYMVEGKLRFLAASDRDTWPQFTGLIHAHIVPSKVLSAQAYERVRRIVEDACRRMEIQNGPAYFQMKVVGDSPYIIEMTPRLDGCHMWKLLKYSTGMDLMKLTLSHLLEGNLLELDAQQPAKPMALTFFCQEPRTLMKAYSVPEQAVDSFFYYQEGDMVRPVNGKYDKVGYYIHPLTEES